MAPLLIDRHTTLLGHELDLAPLPIDRHTTLSGHELDLAPLQKPLTVVTFKTVSEQLKFMGGGLAQSGGGKDFDAQKSPPEMLNILSQYIYLISSFGIYPECTNHICAYLEDIWPQ